MATVDVKENFFTREFYTEALKILYIELRLMDFLCFNLRGYDDGYFELIKFIKSLGTSIEI